MGLETGTKWSDLVVTNPTSSDARGTTDDHLRLIKTVAVGMSTKSLFDTVTNTGTTATATAGVLQICTNAGAVTLTLPASPAAGDLVGAVFTNNGATNVLGRNSQPIQSAASDKTLSAYVANSITTWRYVDATRGWLPEQY